jgi:glutathione S-transferase
MAVKLHRCKKLWLRVDLEPCWRVQHALDDMGIEYELVEHPHRRGRRDELARLTGQRLLPVIELEDGRTYRAESKDMAARIRAGRLFEGAEAQPER